MISAEGFSFEYPTKDEPALSDLSFGVDEGDVLGVVGPVEAGKTTLAMVLAGFAPQNTGGTTSGDVSVAGRDPRSASDNKVAMVFEDYAAQLTQVRVIDEVIAPLVNRGIGRSEAHERARELLEQVRLSDAGEKFTWELSGGQQQRLALAAALAIDPEVMIFDTATDMLDPEGRDDVANLIASLASEKTLVVTENDPDALVGIADELLVLDDGDQVAVGPADDLLRDIDLLEDVGVAPPVCRYAAREVGLSGEPITPGEFLDALQDIAADLPTSSGVPEESAYTSQGAPEGEAAFGDPLVRVEDATYRYGKDELAVDGVEFTVHEGEVHAVLGGNGAGKTTFSKLLSGLLKPSEGTVYVGDEPTEGRTARDIAETVGIALQNPDEQISEQTVEAEIRFPLERRQYERTGFLGLSKQERYTDDDIDDRVEEIRAAAGLPPGIMDEDPVFLPRGLRRQVTIATALAPDPDVLVLDEPAAGVDATAQTRVRETIDRFRHAGKGVVLIDHDMDFVCDVADRITILEDGEVAMQGPTEEVFAPENWEWLANRHLRPPKAARLAQRVGIEALTAEEFVETFAPLLEVSQ